MAFHPVTYVPPATQDLLRHNRSAVTGKPYARFFRERLEVSDELLPALREPLPADQVLPLTPEGVNRLLDPGYLPGETGYRELPDGSAYVASRVPFPGSTGEMFRWWFWWHAVEPERYTLWYPTNHIAVRSLQPDRLTRPGLTHEQRYVGTTHRVQEYIGPQRVDVEIEFCEPGDLGLDVDRFAAAGVVAHACAHVRFHLPRLDVATMIHLAREVPGGLELRSRYWLGHSPGLNLGGTRLPLALPGRLLGITRRMAGARVGYEQLLHDQIEFTHLAGFLPEIFAEFGSPDPASA